jgi:hypothetical protein
MRAPFQANSFSLSALIGLAGLALWLLLAGPGHLFGLRTGYLGILVLMAGAWGLLYAVSRVSPEALDAAASPAEWNARIGLTFCAVAVVYFLAKMSVFSDAPLPHNPAATEVGRHLVLLLIAWSIVCGIVASRRKGAVEQDERDREIATKAAGWWRGAVVFGIVVLAVTLSFTPMYRLHWATPLMIGNLLILALMLGSLCEYVATLTYYVNHKKEYGRDSK